MLLAKIPGPPPEPGIGTTWVGCFKDGAATLSCLPLVFYNIIGAALLFAGVVAVFMIIIGGIKFLTSGGDPKQVEGARNTLTWAVVGLIIVLLSFAILSFIGFITGTTDIITTFKVFFP